MPLSKPPSPGGRSNQRDRTILLLDCDAFFVQVARREDPDGAGRAERLLVGGSSGRGVVTSASYAVRAFGVRSGMPVSEALRLCPDALVVPVPRGACMERSRAIRAELETLAPVVQAASIDEFYLDLTGTERLFGGESLAETAARIRGQVREATGILVSVGGATNRLVAKLAASRAKPHAEYASASGVAAGVFIVPPGGEADFMASLAVAQIPGVGPALAGELEERGIVTVPDLLTVEAAWLARWIGEGRATWLRERALGRDDSEVTSSEARKSISAERTYGTDVPPGPAGDAELEGRLLELSMSVGSTLREKGFRARTITVKLRDADFSTRQRSHTLPEAVESDRALYEVGRAMLRELRARGRATRLLGIGVAGFEDEAGVEQLDLIGPDEPGAPVRPESDRDRTLSRVADQVRARYGDDAIRPGRVVEGRRSRVKGSEQSDRGEGHDS